jgi:oligoendopeptidase F
MLHTSIPTILVLLPLLPVSAQISIPTPIPNYSTVARDQVPEAFRWRIEDIYSSVDAWKADLAQAREDLEHLGRMEKDWTRSASGMADCLDALRSVNLKTGKLKAYASLQAQTHTGEAQFKDLKSESNQLAVALNARIASMETAILKLGQKEVHSYLRKEPRLQPYREQLDQALRKVGHVLSDEAEQVLSETALFSGGAQSAAMTLQRMESPKREAILPDGSTVALSGPAYWKLAQSKDPRERRAADEGMVSDVKPLENTFAALLDTCAKKDLFEARVRHHSDCLAAEVFPHQMDPAVIRNLVASLKANLGPYHRYLRLKKRILGLQEAHHYDLAQPIILGPRLRFPFDEARNMTQKATAILGPEYAALMKRAFDERWVDVYGHQGKLGLGSLTAVPGVHPFVLLDYRGSFFDFITVAHELGHGMQYVLSEHNQPYGSAEPSYLLTEVPSTFNEILLVRHLLEQPLDDRTKLAILVEFLDRLELLLVFDARVAELENAMHAHVEKGGTLTAEWLNTRFLAIARDYYDHDQSLILVDDYVKSNWNYYNTFSDTFRGYKVLLATVASLAMTDQVLKGGEPEAKRYMNFLKAGCSKPSLDILEDAGVDLTQPETVAAAMRAFDGWVDQMEALQAKLESGAEAAR